MRPLLFIIAACGGLCGAAGVAAATAAAHLGGGTLLETAALFLMVHAAATFGIVALATRAPGSATLFAIGGLLMIAGTILFCGDFAMRALANRTLFSMAAPGGGIVLISGWLMTAVGAARSAIRRDRSAAACVAAKSRLA
jgi:uncharacterized membrane protein YgdD (TMEM256/DUF423 family)